MSHDGKYVVIHDKSQLTCDNLTQAKARAGLNNLDAGEDVYRAYMLVEVSDDRMRIARLAQDYEDGEFYVCPQHTRTGGYESCCNCGGWDEGAPDYGKLSSGNVTRRSGRGRDD